MPQQCMWLVHVIQVALAVYYQQLLFLILPLMCMPVVVPGSRPDVLLMRVPTCGG